MPLRKKVYLSVLALVSVFASYYSYRKQSVQAASSFVAIILAGLMFSDTFMGSVDMASAGVRYIYDKAATSLHNPVNDYPAEDREGYEIVKRLKVGGLYNEGNTCFMNTVVQSLASLQHLKRVVQENVDQADSDLSLVLNRLIDKLNDKRGYKHTYSTHELIKSLDQESRYSGYDQEDAQEFFQALLEKLEKDIKKRVTVDTKKQDVPVTPFDGVSATRVGCLECGEMEGIRRGVVSSLDLSLSGHKRNEEITLESLIDEYCRMETISGVECYRCSLVQYKHDLQEKIQASPEKVKGLFEMRLKEVEAALDDKVINEDNYKRLKPNSRKEECEKSKQTMLAAPTADIVMVHVNRSVFNFYTGHSTKNYTPVKFQSILDLRPWVIDTKSPVNYDPKHPMQPMDNDSQLPLRYALKAVIVHFGSHNFGHYVCFRKCNQGYWWRISDHAVELAYEHQVLNAQGVFMLFYEKITMNNEKQDEGEDEKHEFEEGTDITDVKSAL